MTGLWGSHLDELAGRTIVVTGAGGGIGSSIVASFPQAQIVAIDYTEELAFAPLSRRPSGSPATLALGVDLADPQAVSASLKQIRAFSKDVAALINVAGIAHDATIPMLSRSSLLEHFEINFVAAFSYSQFVARMMQRSGGGSIVNVASITGIDGNRGQAAYGASKAALINLSRTMSLELGSSGIRINAVAPGIIDTPMTQSLGDEALAELSKRPQLGRLGQPAEVAAVVQWLVSSASSYVTGQVIRVDGCI